MLRVTLVLLLLLAPSVAHAEKHVALVIGNSAYKHAGVLPNPHLIGIDPDYRLHVSERLLGQNDGPMVEAQQRLKGGTNHLPGRIKDRPDRDRLAQRFERFKAVA